MRDPADAEPWHPPLLIPPKYSPAELAEGEEEIKLLHAVYKGVLDASGKLAYAYFGAKRWQYRSELYLDDRAAFFGSTPQYLAYLDVARAELDAEDGKLRSRLDPSHLKPPLPLRWREAQGPFYAWTRRAYEKRLGAGVSVPALINAGMSKTLEAALRQVRADYGGGFRTEGFSPRPIKTNDGYCLGTLSDHALGTAIDINTGTNAVFTTAQWASILAYTSESLDLVTRRKDWASAPASLHAAVRRISVQFSRKVSDAVAALQTSKPGLADADALAAVVAADPHLTQLKLHIVKRWRGGFFDLPWSLVKELHEEKFIWGATFERPDLHHFELP
jgi:hypothetical protein